MAHPVPSFCAAVIGHHKTTNQICAMYGYGNSEASAKRELADWVRIHNVIQDDSSLIVLPTDRKIEPSFTHKKFYIID